MLDRLTVDLLRSGYRVLRPIRFRIIMVVVEYNPTILERIGDVDLEWDPVVLRVLLDALFSLAMVME